MFLIKFPFFWGGVALQYHQKPCLGEPLSIFFFDKGTDPANDSLKTNKNEIQGDPMSIFFLDVTTRLQRVHIFNETKFKIPSIDLYCIKMNLKHFYPSPHLQNCLTSARLKFRKGSGFSGKCQTHLKNFSRQKLSSGWQ